MPRTRRTFTAPLAFIRTTPPRLPSGWLERLEILARNRAVRAIGETGLDFNRNYSPQPAQRAVFDAQLALAVRLSYRYSCTIATRAAQWPTRWRVTAPRFATS